MTNADQMTPRQRILAVLDGDLPDRVPFTWKQPYRTRGHVERMLRNAGMAMVWRCEVVTTIRPHVQTIRREYREQGATRTTVTYHTPAGDISQTWQQGSGYGSSKALDYPIKRPRDYDVAQFIIADEQYTPNYDKFSRAEQAIGQDGFVFGGWMPPSPLMTMLWNWLGPMQFALHSIDLPEEFEHLFNTLLQSQQKQYEIAAHSPAKVIHMDENMTADMIGLERFQRYCIPVYDRFATCLHENGKLLAAHMDGKMKLLAQSLAKSKLDVIEGFCPAPDGDLELAEARRVWADKILWINFPSAVHLSSIPEIQAQTRKLLRDAAPGDRFLFGVTEDIPEGVWDVSMPAIMEVLSEQSALPLSAC